MPKHPTRNLQLDSPGRYKHYCDIETKQEVLVLCIWGEERMYLRSLTASTDWYLVSSIALTREVQIVEGPLQD